MSRFSYTSLSSQDFEDLARDVLQAEWGVSLEAFRSGRDQGIDLRYSRPKGDSTIIQCKHYIGSGFSALLSHLKNQELPKVKQLNPGRYVVVTSVALSSRNKDAIKRALHPFIQQDADIVSSGDIDGMLSRHSEVLRTNFKLWLTSTEVLNRVIHNAEVCHAEYVVERIKQNIPRFVQGNSFAKAMDILTNQRVVVISGVPGIGKTTLAEMLLYGFLEQGYQPVVIQAEITEGRNLYRKGEKQIFYYDDFLGQFFLGDRSEYFGRNQDAALVDFIDMVRRSENTLFVLTTREHLLHQAMTSSERFNHGRLLDSRYVLEISEYSFGDKARILYNHLYFSDLPGTYRQEMLRDDFFLTVIRHPNFNPRLIEWLSTFVRVRTTAPASYRAFVERLLDAPHELWRYAFKNQLSEQAQDVLLAFYSLGESSHLPDLEPVWEAVHNYRSRKYNRALASQGIRTALQEVEGAFLSYSESYIEFINPSIREFVADLILTEQTTAKDLLESSIRFKQVVNIYRLAQSMPKSRLMELIRGNLDAFSRRLARVLDGPTMRWEHTRFGQRGYQIDLSLERKIEFILEVASLEKSHELATLAANSCANLLAEMDNDVNFYGTILVLNAIKDNEWFMSHNGQTSYRAILEKMLVVLYRAAAGDWLKLYSFVPKALEWSTDDQLKFDAAWTEYCEHGLTDEIDNCGSIEDYTYLSDTLSELSIFGTDFTDRISDLEEAIEELSGSEEELEEGDDPPPKPAQPPKRHVTDEDVRQMFYTLSESLQG